MTSELVLRNVRSSLRIDWRGLVAELRRIGDRPLGEFLEETGLDLDDIYRRRRGGWAGLRRQAGLEQRPATHRRRPTRRPPSAGCCTWMIKSGSGCCGVCLANRSRQRSNSQSPRERRLLSMLHFSLWGAASSLDQMPDGFRRLWDNPGRLQELSEVADLLQRADPSGHPSGRCRGQCAAPDPCAIQPRRGARRVRRRQSWLGPSGRQVGRGGTRRCLLRDAPQDRDSTTRRRPCTRTGRSLRRCFSGSRRAPHRPPRRPASATCTIETSGHIGAPVHQRVQGSRR